MNRRTASSLLLTLLIAAPAPTLWAQTGVVERNVNLRRDPSTAVREIRLLRPPDRVTLLDTALTNRYYHVVTEDADTGFVWSPNLRIIPDTDPSVVAVATEIDTGWPKPAPDVRTFTINGQTCGAGGNGGDTGTNRLKNRIDTTATFNPVTFGAIATLAYPADLPSTRANWLASHTAAITPSEGVAVTLTGFLVALKVQNGGSGETTNCRMTRVSEVDWHMAIAESAGDGEAESIVVETTPRVRRSHPLWTESRLRPWVDSDDPVRISGWLMMDPQHRNHLGRYRNTLWEIHPVTRIEVRRNGQWVSLDSLPNN